MLNASLQSALVIFLWVNSGMIMNLSGNMSEYHDIEI